ncbi:LOW QUALITY PROTEIN: protein FAM200A-like [Chaetodon auriga]|uniref:LOW QUALITY PROTEIN: protein FAM200A-like n=1 Tax=Chaetodon auriga TaxID=39042 RepID=UPI00403299F1
MLAWLSKKSSVQNLSAAQCEGNQGAVQDDADANTSIASDENEASTGSNVQGSEQERPAKRRKIMARPYKDYFLNYGFVNCAAPSHDARPMCVICREKLANESLKPTKLKRHLETLHPDLVDKPLDFFQRKAREIKASADVLRKNVTLNEKVQLASYKVASGVAMEKEPHTIAERLILPSAIDMVSIVIDEKSAEKIKSVPLSNNTVSQRIHDIADNLEEQLVSRLKKAGCFSIQLDESTDVSDCATLLVYVRYPWENDFMEDLLCCLNIPMGTTGEDIFRVLNDYMIKSGLDWGNCAGVTSDGAANMTGRKSGVVARIKEAAGKEITWNHCFIHRQALACKGMPPALEKTLSEVVRVVNFVRASSLNHRLFDQLCTDIGAEHTHLLFHTEVRWLSKGRVLTRFYELRHEIHAFLIQKKSHLAELFTDEWLLNLSYLADIFSSLNELNLKLQGRHDNVFINLNNVQAFQKSLKLWVARLRRPDPSLYMFPTLQQHIEEQDVVAAQVNRLSALIQSHLAVLVDRFDGYFPQEKYSALHNKRWIQNPFEFETAESLLELTLSPAEEAELLQLSCDGTLKKRHECAATLSSFWIGVSAEYPVLSGASISVLIPFTTTYMCELGFSVLTKTKTKHRNRLNAAADMRVALSSCTPDWNALQKRRQAHPSH